jgi:uncharacterized protein YciI
VKAECLRDAPPFAFCAKLHCEPRKTTRPGTPVSAPGLYITFRIMSVSPENSVGDNREMTTSLKESGRPDIPRNLKPYFLCLLRRGERWNVTEGHEDLMQRYLVYLHDEMEARRIIFAGPVTDDSDLIAIVVIEARTAEEAKALVDQNPGVNSGHFVAELHPCFLPALDGVNVQY